MSVDLNGKSGLTTVDKMNIEERKMNYLPANQIIEESMEVSDYTSKRIDQTKHSLS